MSQAESQETQPRPFIERLELSIEAGQMLAQTAEELNEVEDINDKYGAFEDVSKILKRGGLPVAPLFAQMTGVDEWRSEDFLWVVQAEVADLEGKPLDKIKAEGGSGLNTSWVGIQARARARAGANVDTEIAWIRDQLEGKDFTGSLYGPADQSTDYAHLAELIWLNGGDPTNEIQKAEDLKYADNLPGGHRNRVDALIGIHLRMGNVDRAEKLIDELRKRIETMPELYASGEFGSIPNHFRMKFYDFLIQKRHHELSPEEKILWLSRQVGSGERDKDRLEHLISLARIQHQTGDDTSRMTLQVARDVSSKMSGSEEYLFDMFEVRIHEGVDALVEVALVYVDIGQFDTAIQIAEEAKKHPEKGMDFHLAQVYAAIAVAKSKQGLTVEELSAVASGSSPIVSDSHPEFTRSALALLG
ncbi:hypothetical protein A3D80_04720 [Candidatus Roizmanbacteria bacterium RIFCSPHIGHO2_02_FULL_40_13b]|uniref:Uncharacterized protein n=1 Tax=Candidatus Roizmanbacteria bacterium RIFCSPHIGHO2_01_FULL_39_24 TaxID=1802032 RepID=A0A1F7GKZ0_9BACT|nr:MAG: hypothetical protein A2799_04625 [Candidatus Roizmanbacteria bacterium RIFCSPHIGHO2_01_FULL_39_24]OGK28028.1 MAG: hypothetical protein A3D80_04720 [Candidatus Roizmanbacteria bacterium RIFCSPHIGHO2_02_FULL_40_13b]OGK50293.1 MAG: hypothetical protein A3A56_04370 [Candidatus Roizmanbacteria bacterium RIFCSPLOWO2_01_FULL_40_32]